ncbi:MAG: antibiotic biosynthesis monooxygenase [Planctomycetaceae bacterium]|nr:antibiotic biosynthesis monooxygenase [Planctomycetaceae bacterium]
MKYFVIASYWVKDFQAFRNEFDSAQEMLQSSGFKRTYLNRDVEDPSHLIVVHECEDVDKARAFYESREFKDCLGRAGVVDGPHLTYIEELARTRETIIV